MFPIRRHARTLGLVDAPNERSSHRFVTPRSGGIGIILATAASLWFLGSSGHVGVPAWMLFGAASLIGAVGVLDDRFGLPPVVRLVAHLGAAMIVVGTLGPVSNLPLPAPMNIALPTPLLSWTFSLLWIVAVTNFFNFMDGIDGLAGAQAAATCAGVAAAAWSADAASLAVAVGGACLGFLVHNWPPARVFMGDSGSGFLGFVLAGLPFLAPPARRSDAVLAVAVGMMLFLLDPVVTLFRRARAGKNILRAHREHLYQQLVAPEEPAGRLTAAYAATALLLALAGAAGYRFPALMWFGCIASVCAFLAVWRRASQAQRAHAH